MTTPAHPPPMRVFCSLLGLCNEKTLTVSQINDCNGTLSALFKGKVNHTTDIECFFKLQYRGCARNITISVSAFKTHPCNLFAANRPYMRCYLENKLEAKCRPPPSLHEPSMWSKTRMLLVPEVHRLRSQLLWHHKSIPSCILSGC